MTLSTGLMRLLLEPEGAPHTAGPELEGFWLRWQRLGKTFTRPFEHAAAAGYAADRLGWAFVGGYQAAGRVLAPELPDSQMFSLCVTEATGNRPRDIKTRLDAHPSGDGSWILDGAKAWASLGAQSSILFVIATLGPGEDGRQRLRTVRVTPDTEGVVVIPQPPTPFTPEIGHASVRFDQVRVPAAAVDPDDAYLEVVKPFRTIEDIHVIGAALGYLIGCSHAFRWPPDVAEEALALLTTLGHLATQPPLDPLTHRVLHGVLAAYARLLTECEPLWMKAPAEESQRWTRDRKLLGVAARARDARLERAREQTGANRDGGEAGETQST